MLHNDITRHIALSRVASRQLPSSNLQLTQSLFGAKLWPLIALGQSLHICYFSVTFYVLRENIFEVPNFGRMIWKAYWVTPNLASTVTEIWVLFGKFRIAVQGLHTLYPCLLNCSMCQSWCSPWVIPHLSYVYFNTHAVGGTMSPTDMYVRILSLRVVRFGARASGVIRFGWSHEDGTFIKSDKVPEKTFQARSPSWPMTYGKCPSVSQKESSWESLQHDKPSSDCNPLERWENPLLGSATFKVHAILP